MGAGGDDLLIQWVWLSGVLASAPPVVFFDGVTGSAGSAGALERVLSDSLAARGSVMSPDTLLKLRQRGECTSDRSEAAVAKCLQKAKLEKIAWVQAGPVQSVFSRIVWFPLWGRRTWSLAGEATLATKDARRSKRFSVSFVQSLGFVGTAAADRFPTSSTENLWAAESLSTLASKDLAAFLFADSTSGGSAPLSP